MKAKVIAKIDSMERLDGRTILSFDADGKIESAAVGSKDIEMKCTLSIKDIVANKLSIGSKLVFDISIQDDEAV